ncbi:glycoside hydrolase family 28 protein [Thiotrichales bacterium 19S3-7]|nr:glycoside hydrolase family 28 protein [Thiotrichales bacterium 19S3-7]MCF6802716.1 glycoside hydrolase family 28 protein [Thiotrichales bacterium 19S3-11]
MRRLNLIRIAVITFFSITASSLAQASVSVNCQKTDSRTHCDFSGSAGSNLSKQILKTLNSYPNNVTLNILPGNYTVSPIDISDHKNIIFNLSANTTLTAVKQSDPSWEGVKALFSVRYSKNFTLSGADPQSSIIDGRGKNWWKLSHDSRPEFIYFRNIDGLTIQGISLHNSPKYNIEVNHGSNVNIHNILIDAPADSPNTDGINMTSVSDVSITNIQVTNGDDCIAINADPVTEGMSNNIVFSHSTCNYGHGVSIGSNVHNTVSDVTIDHITLNQSNNGLRIKSHCEKDDCSDTKEAVIKRVTYKNISMNGVGKPIFYDLTFDNKDDRFSLVKIKDITYDHVQATNSTIPASFICENPNRCSPINVTSVSIDTGGVCQGVNGTNPDKTKPCPFSLD